MATSLTRDPNFATALATAISGRILDLEKRWIYYSHIYVLHCGQEFCYFACLTMLIIKLNQFSLLWYFKYIFFTSVYKKKSSSPLKNLYLSFWSLPQLW
jgi:hypothetical protein